MMKRITLLSALSVVAIATVVLPACVSVDAGHNGEDAVVFGNGARINIRPSNSMATRQFTLGNFDEIDASRVDVVYSVGTPGTATLNAPDNVIDYIKVKNDHGTLKLWVDNDVNINGRLNATLTVSSRNINEITATLAAKVEVTTPLVVDGGLDLEGSTSGSIVLGVVKCEKADFDFSTAATVHVTSIICEGKLDIDASTSASITIDKAIASSLDADAATAASVKVAAGSVGKVDLEAATAGKVKVAADITGGKASAATGGSVRTHVDKLSEKTTTTGGNVKGL